MDSRCTEERCNMKKPYIICHMMISIDGRIDCAMTSKLPGVDDYYISLEEILAEQFGVERMGVVGGPKINTAFLEAGLLDEISLLVGAGIDGRGGMPAVFDGLAMQHDVTKLKLIDVKKFDSDAVWIRYRC